ncbi:MAG: hypothetical protein U9Q12_01110 [Patescibacteria group bacterium]|nr:hypothetical protein [Patescibacteria group bacterium]
MKFTKFFQYILVASFIFFVPTIVFAFNSGIAVDQTSVAFDMVDEDEQKFVVEVKNISNHVQNVHVRAVDYLIGDNNEITLSNESDEENGVRDWVSIADADIILESGDVQNVPIVVKTPDNAHVGSHRGAILFSFVTDDENAINVGGQVGVHTLINVKGDVHAAGRVNSFDIPLFTTKPITYAAEFENLGNIHYVPYGEVVVRNVFTKNDEVYKYDKHFVFPNNKYEFSVEREIPSIFGLYKATASFVDGEGVTRSKTDYTMGYLFPVVFIITFIMIIIIIKIVYTKGKAKKQKFRFGHSQNARNIDTNNLGIRKNK